MRIPIATESKAKALAIASACVDKKASNVTVLHVAKLTSIADYLVICSADSERQVRAIADYVGHQLSAARCSPLNIEGTTTSQWILMDFADVIVHVFRSDIREHYALERLWADAKPVRIPVEATPPATQARPVKRRVERERRAR